MSSLLREQLVSGFLAANPHMALGAAPPAPMAGASATPTSAARVWDPSAVSRVVEAGGDAAARLLHPTFIPFEKMYGTFRQQGVYQASQQNNFVFELGAFRVPQQMAFALVDYRFSLYRLSGAAAGDWIELEDRRLSGQIGYDVLIADYRKANLSYELEPTEIQDAKEASEQPLSAGRISARTALNENLRTPTSGP